MDNLLVFGDSWPAGAELENRQDRFPVIMAKILNVNLIDLSKDGTSIGYGVYAFLNFLSQQHNPAENYRLLFCLTEPQRDFLLDNGNFTHMTVNSKNSKSIIYYKHIWSQDQMLHDLQKNLLLVAMISELYKIPCYFVQNWHTPSWDKLWLPLNLNFYKSSLAKILDLEANVEDFPDENEPEFDFFYQCKINGQKYIHPSTCHPNKLGHTVIAKHLVEWIKT